MTEDGAYSLNMENITNIGDAAVTNAGKLLDRVVYTVLRPSVAILGSVANIINVIVFYKLGINDSMSLGLFSLSVSDLLVTTVSGFGVFSYLVSYFYEKSLFDADSIYYVISWGVDIVYITSCWITTMLAVERCVCVTRPFEIKTIFTLKRSFIIIIFLCVLSIVVHYPIMGLLWWFEWEDIQGFNSNTTLLKIVIVKSDDNPGEELYVLILNAAILLVPPEVIVGICTVWMIRGISKSSEIRGISVKKDDGESMPNDTSSEPAEQKDSKNGLEMDEKDASRKVVGKFKLQVIVKAYDNLKRNKNKVVQKSKRSVKSKAKLSKRERKLAKTVILLVTIMTACNMPRFLVTYGTYYLPEINYNMAYYTIFVAVANLIDFFGLFCSSINIFVYLTIHRNFRAALKQLCSGNVPK